MSTATATKTTITTNGRIEAFVASASRRRAALRAECACGWHSNAYRNLATVELVRATHELTCLDALDRKAASLTPHQLVGA